MSYFPLHRESSDKYAVFEWLVHDIYGVKSCYI